MAAFVKIRRVTDPARLIHNDFSSGSDHSVDYENANTIDSPGMSYLVHDFLERQESVEEAADESELELGDDSDSDYNSEGKDTSEEIIKRVIADKSDPFKNLLAIHVSRAIAFLESRDLDKPALRRNVMGLLRGVGYNAAVCKAKWVNSGSLIGGNYEYVDVISTNGGRYFVDLDFAGEFDIARPTQQYTQLLRVVPVVFVGTGEELKLVVKAVSDAIKRSLKAKELSFPPWRKNRYMQTKWFGSYRRTMNVVPVVKKPLFAPKCLSLGFDGTTKVV